MNAECAAHLNTLTFVPELVKFKDDAFVASHVDVGSILVNKGKVILSQVASLLSCESQRSDRCFSNRLHSVSAVCWATILGYLLVLQLVTQH